jgi:small GTP-binding protein
MRERNQSFKICLLGDSAVGKTCIVTAKTKNEFNQHQMSTIGVDNVFDTHIFDNKKYIFKIYDTVGQERYNSVSSSSIKVSDGFILVYDVNQKETFDRIEKWMNFIIQNAEIDKKVLILIGNKIDINEREVEEEIAKKFAEDNNMKYFETSAKTRQGIQEAFKGIYEGLIKQRENENEKSDEENQNKSISLDEQNPFDEGQKKRKCCPFSKKE